MFEPITPDPPRPIRRFASRQQWLELTFLHWPIDAGALSLPPSLKPDLWQGQAYIGLVPFTLQFTGLGTFPETNLRTYVVDDQGRRGVWCDSLDADRLAAVVGARTAYGLPYYWARMQARREGHRIHYSSRRRHGPRRESDLVVEYAEEIEHPSDFEHFLTARWRLFALRLGSLVFAEVDHPRWPLHRARLIHCRQTFVESAETPLVHYSPGVAVEASLPARAGL